jgi:uncharacterized membrane protein (DUF2068 family)
MPDCGISPAGCGGMGAGQGDDAAARRGGPVDLGVPRHGQGGGRRDPGRAMEPAPVTPEPAAADQAPTTTIWRRAARVPLWLRLVALGKLAKGVGFLLLGLAAARVARFGVEGTIEHWLAWVHLDPAHGHANRILAWFKVADPGTLRHFGIGFFIYSGVLFIEAIGLWFDRGWAEWLVIGVAAALVPLELYELVSHATATRWTALAINLVVVAALAVRLRNKHRGATL